MPWTTDDDVEKHKKGLDEKGKARWRDTANSVLADCIKKGGTDETCAPKAIRIANGVTGNLAYYAICIDKQEPNYIVKEKMHQGRNHYIVPVVMMVEGVHKGNHGALLHTIDELGKFPETWNGIPVVINHPEVDGINVSANDPDIIDQQTVGRVYNTHVDGTRLKAEAWIDVEKLKELSSELLAQFKKGELVEVSLGMFNDEVETNGDWNGETYEAIAKSHRPDHLALLPGGRGACSIADGCGIRVNSGLEVKLVLDEKKLVRGLTRTRVSNLKQKEVTIMSDEKCTPCVKKKVDDLIENNQRKFTEDDRELLETLDEAFLDKIAEPVIVEKEVIKEKTVEVNVLSAENQEIIDDWKRQKKEKRDAVIKTIQDNLGKDTWTDEVLGGMKDEILEKVTTLIKKKEVVDYSVVAGRGLSVNENTQTPLLPPGIDFETKK